MKRFLAGLVTGLVVGAGVGVAVWAWSPWDDEGDDATAAEQATEAEQAALAAAEIGGTCQPEPCDVAAVGRVQPRVWLLRYRERTTNQRAASCFASIGTEA